MCVCEWVQLLVLVKRCVQFRGENMKSKVLIA